MRIPTSVVWLVPVSVGLAAFGAYRMTLAPGLTWAHAGTDGGDLVTAAVVWGVPHPPGYPTYTLLGRLFAFLPFGIPAFNLNLMSAVCAALAAALIAAGVLKCLPRTALAYVAASVAGLTLAFGPMLWGQAVIAEVHALNALFVAAICYVVPPWVVEARTPRFAKRMVLGALWGLGLGNSPTLLAMAPIALPALWSDRKGRWAGFAALAVGLSVYALIPIRASAQPAINWGDARSLPDMAWLVGGGLYHGYLFAAPVDLIAQRMLSLPRLWLEQIGWLGVVWIVLSATGRRDLRRAASTAVSVLLYVTFAVSYNTADSDLYLIPVWVLSAGYLGMGLFSALKAHVVAERRWRIALAIVAVAAVTVMLIVNWGDRDLSDDRAASDFADDVLSSAPSGAILITHTDAHTFTLWYYRLVDGRRRDVSIVDARLAGYTWYEPMLLAQGAAPLLPQDRSESGLAQRLAAKNPTRPVCDMVVQSQREDPPRLQCD